MRSPFRKPAETAPATTAANPITQNDLREQISIIRGQIDALARERAELSLASLQGQASATSTIASIDQERLRLSAQLETVEAALHQLQRQHREQRTDEDGQRRRERFERQRPMWVRAIEQQTRFDFENLAFNLVRLPPEQADKMWTGGAMPGMPQNDPGAPPGVKNIPYRVAMGLVAGLCTVRTATPHPTDPAITRYADVLDQKLADEFIGVLLRDAKLPDVSTDDRAKFIAYYAQRYADDRLPNAIAVRLAR